MKTIIKGYQEITHILSAEILDLDKLAEAGGEVVEEFSVEVQRAKLETDYLVRISVPADKIDQFGGIATSYTDGKWTHSQIKKEDHAITEEIEEPEPVETFGLDEADPLFATKLQILQAEKAAQLAKEAEQKAAQEAAALAAKLAADEALTAKAIAVKAKQKKNKKLAVTDALRELQAKSEE